MPAYAVIKLSKVGSSAFTATVCPQLRAKDVNHAFTTGLWVKKKFVKTWPPGYITHCLRTVTKNNKMFLGGDPQNPKI